MSAVSTGAAGFFELAGEVGKADFPGEIFAGFSGGGISRKPGGSGEATSGTGCSARARR